MAGEDLVNIFNDDELKNHPFFVGKNPIMVEKKMNWQLPESVLHSGEPSSPYDQQDSENEAEIPDEQRSEVNYIHIAQSQEVLGINSFRKLGASPGPLK